MIFKTKLTIGAAIIIGAIIINTDNSTDSPYIEVTEYNDTYSNSPQGQKSNTHNINYTPNKSDGNARPRFNNNGYSNSMNKSIAPKSNQSITHEGLKLAPMMDTKRGIPLGYYPIPTSWNVKADGWHGPQKTEIKFLTSNFMDLSQKRYQSPRQLLTQGEIGDLVRQNNGKVSDIKRLNSIAQCDNNYNRAMALSNTERWNNEAISFALEVDGVKGYGIIKTTKMTTQMGGGWTFSLISIDANPSYLDQALRHLIHAQSNYKPNMQQIAMYKSDHNNKMNQNQNSHNSHMAKMRNNQRNFDASNQAIVSANNATNDAIMSSSRYSTESFNRSSEKIANSIFEENTVINPYDGTTHQTSNMYDRTFIDAFGNQIQTNDQFYQPGMDPNVNGYSEVYPNGGYN